MDNVSSETIVPSTAWDAKVRATGIHCEICGTPPTYEEHDEFLATGLCRACADAVGDIPTLHAA